MVIYEVILVAFGVSRFRVAAWAASELISVLKASIDMTNLLVIRSLGIVGSHIYYNGD